MMPTIKISDIYSFFGSSDKGVQYFLALIENSRRVIKTGSSATTASTEHMILTM